jgi:hypothetical protein
MSEFSANSRPVSAKSDASLFVFLGKPSIGKLKFVELL